MARAALDWSIEKLAQQAKVGEATVRRFEKGLGTPINATLGAIYGALEAGGVLFIDQNGEGPGVRLKKQDRDS